MAAAAGTHVPELDGLRGLAIALVLVYHSLPWASTTSPLWKATYYTASAGWVGVDLFFVISGYLITGILLDGLGRPGQLRAFYARRVLRIFPAYYALLAVLLGLHVLGLAGGYPDVARILLACVLYVSNLYYGFSAVNSTWAPLGVTWSLAVEEQFYLVWPWVVRRAGRKGLVLLCLALLLGVTSIRVLLVASGFRGWAALHYLTIFKFDALGAGGLLAAVVRDPSLSAADLHRGLRRLALLAWPAAALLFATNGLNRSSPVLHSVGFAVLSAAFGCLVGWSALPAGGPLSFVLRAAPLRYLGRISYGLYLYHQVPNWLFEDYLGPRWLASAGHPAQSLARFAFVWVAALAAAEASWRLVEVPFLRLKPPYPEQRPPVDAGAPTSPAR